LSIIITIDLEVYPVMDRLTYTRVYAQ
jgi:hypothetical protein